MTAFEVDSAASEADEELGSLMIPSSLVEPAFRSLPILVFASGVIRSASPGVVVELGLQPASFIGLELHELGVPLNDTALEHWPNRSVEVRLGPEGDDLPVRLRPLTVDGERWVAEIRNMSREYCLEALLRRGEHGHVLMSPDMEVLHSTVTDRVSAILPDPDGGWAPSIDPDDLASLEIAVQEVTQDPKLVRHTSHRLLTEQALAFSDTVESALTDPDLRGVLIRTRLENEVPAPSDDDEPPLTIADNLPTGIIVANRAGKTLYRNRAALDLLALPKGEVLYPAESSPLFGSLSEWDRAEFDRAFSVAIEGMRSRATLPNPEAEGGWVRFSFAPSAGSSITINTEDITDLVNAEQTIEAQTAFADEIDRHRKDVMLTYGPDLEPVFISATVERVLGRDVTDMSSVELNAYVHPEDAAVVHQANRDAMASPGVSIPVRFRFRSTDGFRWFEGHATNELDNPAVNGVIWALRDVTDRLLMEEQLTFRANFDSLTSLHNRTSVVEFLTKALAEDAVRGRHTSVIFCDVDRFKSVNDSLGHHAGDILLSAVANRLRGSVRKQDLVGRFGGDEFVVIAPGLRSAEEATGLAERLFKNVIGVVDIGGMPVNVSLSMGVTVTEPQQGQPDRLLQEADLAMYEAKGNGRGRVEFFTEGMGDSVSRRLRIQGELLEAVERRELIMHYQPIVPIGEDPSLMRGVEGLARWQHPTDGLMDPGGFIEIAEDTGFMQALGHELLRVMCEGISGWTGERPGFFAVNLSPIQLKNRHASSELLRLVRSANLDPGQLTVEITESAFVHGDEVLNNLSELRNAGVQVYLDDFGTGYSSISQLRRFPVDGVKIDQSFIRPSPDVELVSLIVGIAKALGLRTVAEGVETTKQLEVVTSLGIDYAQGFLLGRPGPLPSDASKNLLWT